MQQHSLALLDNTTTPRSTDDLAARTFLARYTGGTRVTYTFAIRRYFNWCAAQGVPPLQMKRPLIEAYSLSMKDDDLAPATRNQQLGIIRTFYRLAVADEYIEKDPSDFVRRVRVHQDESKLTGLTRYEMADLYRAAKQAGPMERCAVNLMGTMALRVSEAVCLRVEDTMHEQKGHRVLKFVGKGEKPATIPLPVRMQRIVDEACGGRESGPLLLRQRGVHAGTAHDRRSMAWTVEQLGRKSGLDFKLHPHMLRHTAISSMLEAGIPLREAQIAARHADPRTTAMYDRARHSLDRHAVHVLSAWIGDAA